MSITLNNVRKFIKLPWKEKKIFGEAVLFLFLIKLMLFVLPFKTCLDLFPEIKNENPVDLMLLNRIKFNIARANRLAFWKNECLVKSMAVRWMLQRRQIPSKLSFGMMLDEHRKPMAHAWIQVNEVEIVGKEGEFIELYSV